MSTVVARRALALAAVLTATGCGVTQQTTGDGDVAVLASFYPLQYAAQEVGGEHVSVTNLTPPGADPHSLEIPPATVQQVSDAALVVYLSGMQPAVDDAVAAAQPEQLVDAAEAADLSGTDPHFWLDPLRLAAVGEQVADALVAADPEHATDYEAGAADLSASMAELDAEYAEQLAQCQGATLVSAHESFGYLAERYGLEQVGIAGLDPDAEPSPARLREIGHIVREHDVHTIFYGEPATAHVTETLAAELDVEAALLDPIESQLDPETDYLGVMQANLQALADGLSCAG